MRLSKYYLPTLKSAPQDAQVASHKLMLRAGLARMLVAGVYLYLPLGLRVLRNIERIIRDAMNKAGALEVLLSALQPVDIWRQSGRDKLIGDVMIRFEDRRGRQMALGPTHEEIITFLAKQDINSYRDLPVTLYQIQTKFRDELRPRFGLIRCCEFIMKDAYSFDANEEGLDKSYKRMFNAYNEIFKRLGLEFFAIEADTGVMGGSESAEFLVPAPCGEDMLNICEECGFVFGGEGRPCPKCDSGKVERKPAIEVGHIFKLGTKYSEALGLKFIDNNSAEKPVVMGCYGIGVSRLISAIIEQHNDEKGIIWPMEVAPFKVQIITAKTGFDEMSFSERIHCALEKKGIEVLWDDRDERAGVKFNDADLIGAPYQIIVGKGLANNVVELKERVGPAAEVPVADIVKRVEELCQR